MKQLSTMVLMLVFCLKTAVYGQSAILSPIFKGAFIDWKIDPLGNLYVISGYDLNKVDSNGKIVLSFSSRNFGEMSGIDVSNPFSPLLIFSRFNAIVELDNSFAIKSQWNITYANRFDDLLVCRIPGQGYWYYDRMSGRPVLLNGQNQIVSEGTPVSNVWSGNATVTDLAASDDLLVLVLQGNGMLLFDRFGTFLRKIDGTAIQFAGFSGPDLYFYRQGSIIKYDLRKSDETIVTSFSESAMPQEVRVSNGRIYLKIADGIFQYIP